MARPSQDILDRLRHLTQAPLPQAHVPYSGRPASAVLLLADGAWVPGVRVESATFSLMLPPLLNAVTTAIAVGRTDIVAAVLSRPATVADAAYLEELPHARLPRIADDAFAVEGALPDVADRLAPFLSAPTPETPADGVALARQVAERAFVPASQFPVGCVLKTVQGRLLPGVNVEHPDWSRILCAERAALGTMCSYGLSPGDALYLTCLHDDAGTPCGACRQWLVERAPSTTLWMDRAAIPPERATPDDLLPGAFSGAALPQPTW
ncbi:MAG: cytidine deaminase [Bacteroidetes bacterium]|jgi:homotetrameric cytidine deaminase|nr:cytidine deaminase [Bacteroidota bacterium]